MLEALIVASAVFGCCGLIFYITSILTKKRWTNFHECYYTTRATVVGYGHNDPAQWSTLVVALPHIKNRSYKLKDTYVNSAEYPVGKEISVYVVNNKVLGLYIPTIWLAYTLLPDPKKKARPLLILALLSAAVSTVLLICSLLDVVSLI